MTEYVQSNAPLVFETGDWVRFLAQDHFCTPKMNRDLEDLPTAPQLFAELHYSNMSIVSKFLYLAMLVTLVIVISLRLLASCSTFLAPSSAEYLGLYQQPTERQFVLILPLHSQHRFTPVASLYVKGPLKAAPSPDFCAFPSPRQTTLERRVPRRRRISSSEHILSFSRYGWTDGATTEILPDEIARKQPQDESSPPVNSHATNFATQRSQSPDNNGRITRWHDISRSSSSVDKTGFLSKLTCQPSTSKHAKQNPRIRVLKLLRKDPIRSDQVPTTIRPLPQCIKSSKLQQLTSKAVQRMPSAIRIRRTQSAPRNVAEKATQTAKALQPRRHSSDPSTRRSLTPHCAIPQIRRISATPAASNCQYASTTGSVRGSGRSELSPTHEPFEEARRNQIELWQSKALFPPQQMKNTPPPSIRSFTSSFKTRRHTLPVGYLNRVNSHDHASDKTEDLGVAGKGVCAQDSLVNNCPQLPMASSTMPYGDEEDSSDSELGLLKKRKSILIPDRSESSAIAKLFGAQGGGSPRP